MEQQIQLNDHNKQEYPPMHTAEHLLNATMVKTFGCPRSRNAHIERKKSKCDYILSSCPTAEQIQSIEDRVNEVISQNLPVSYDYSIPLRGYRNGYRLPFSAQKNSGADQTAPLQFVDKVLFHD